MKIFRLKGFYQTKLTGFPEEAENTPMSFTEEYDTIEELTESINNRGFTKGVYVFVIEVYE